MENQAILIPSRIRQNPTLFRAEVPEANLVSTEQLTVPSDGKAVLPFIEGPSQAVSLVELTQESILPSYADGEIVIPPGQIIQAIILAAHDAMPDDRFAEPEIRASHLVQGRIGSAIYKRKEDLLESDKTKYWERMCFCVEVVSRRSTILQEPVSLTFGACRSLQNLNFHGRKGVEPVSIYIANRCRICSNLLISLEDGLKDCVLCSGPEDIYTAAYQLFSQFNADENAETLSGLGRTSISASAFAHVIGKLRVYSCLSTADKKKLPFNIEIGDSQAFEATRQFVNGHFGLNGRDSIDLFQALNIFNTGVKNSYIHNFLTKNANCTSLVMGLQRSIEGTNHDYDWLLS